jgi:hypothetical protein
LGEPGLAAYQSLLLRIKLQMILRLSALHLNQPVLRERLRNVEN